MDLRLEAENFLAVISEHDPFVSHIERALLDNAIDVLVTVRSREKDALEDAAKRRQQDIDRAGRLGLGLDAIPDLCDYVITRGFA